MATSGWGEIERTRPNLILSGEFLDTFSWVSFGRAAGDEKSPARLICLENSFVSELLPLKETVGLRFRMARRRKRESESEYRGSESEEGEEMTSKPTRVTDDGLGSSAKRRRKKRKRKNEADMTSAIGMWAASLKGPHLDLMVSLKQLAEVRLRNTGEESLASCLTPASLRTIGIILEELIKDRMMTEYPSSMTGLRKRDGDDQLQQVGEGSSFQAGRETEGAGT